MKGLVLTLSIIGLWWTHTAMAQLNETSSTTAFVFGNDSCEQCRNAIKFLFDEGISYTYSDIDTDDNARTLYIGLLQKHEIGEVLPLTVIGETVVVGFQNKQTSGAALRSAYFAADKSDIRTVEEHLARAPKLTPDEPEPCRGLACDTTTNQVVYQIPFLGVVDINAVPPATLTTAIAVDQWFSVFGVGVLLLMAGALLFVDTRKQAAIAGAVFIVVEVLILIYFFNAGFRTHESFLLPVALAKTLQSSVGLLWQQLYILVYSLIQVVDELILLLITLVLFPYIQTLEDARPGFLGVLGTTLLFFGGVILVHRLYFV